MRLQARISVLLFTVAALALIAGTGLLSAQTPANQPPAGQSSTSDSSSNPASSPQVTPDQPSNNGRYISIDPLALVRYDNKYDVSLGMAYRHIKADRTFCRERTWAGSILRHRIGLASTGGCRPRDAITWAPAALGRSMTERQGPFVSEQVFVAGPEWLGPHNKHGAILAHVLVGGAHFNSHTFPLTAAQANFYNDQVAPAAVIGGHFDLNRSAQWVFRVTPDAVITRYGINYGTKVTQTDVNFAISVGIQYKFKKKR